MVTMRRTEAGFTLTEVMVVVVIISVLAALSTPLFTHDNNARKGRDFAKIVAQTLQRARFQSMGDRSNMHVMLYRTQIDLYREEPPTPTVGITFTLLGTIIGPAASNTQTVAIWDARTNTSLPTGPSGALAGTPTKPTANSPLPNEIIFTPLGSTNNNANWRVYIRNELLPSIHPDAGFVINIGGLTGFISSNDRWVPTP
jgi:prepilin-type N-terminal cleavage/methylation domain-containing protein